MVVVNHHLFLADMVVKESGFAELIPEAEVMIFDEAHQRRISLVSTLASRSPASCWTGERHHHCLPHRTERHSAAAKCRRGAKRAGFRLQLGDPGYRGNLRELLADSHIQRALLLLDDALELCYDVAKLSLGRSALLDAALSAPPSIAGA